MLTIRRLRGMGQSVELYAQQSKRIAGCRQVAERCGRGRSHSPNDNINGELAVSFIVDPQRTCYASRLVAELSKKLRRQIEIRSAICREFVVDVCAVKGPGPP